MYSAQEHRAKLQHEAANMLFEAEFNAEIQAQLAQKRSQAGKTLAEKLGSGATDNAP